jgi:ketosteroid isomerase-like protein
MIAAAAARYLVLVNAEVAERLIRHYVDGWRTGDAAKILATVSEDCVITESHGPTYRGSNQISRWIDAWFGAGGEVLGWEIRLLEAAGEVAFFEWSFACRWLGERYEFEGASVVRFRDEKIAFVREYATTAPLYDWEGSWS